MLIVRTSIACLVAVLVLGSVPQAVGPASAAQPTILDVTPGSGPPGLEVQYAGGGFTPGGDVSLVMLEGIGLILDEPTADAAGVASGTFVVPHPDDVPELAFGPVAVWAMDEATGQESPRATFELTDQPPPLTMLPATGPPGTMVEYSGGGFTPGGDVSLVMLEGIGLILDEPTADVDGSISGSFTVPHPEDVPELLFGPVAVWGIDEATGEESARASFELTEDLPPLAIDPTAGPPGTEVSYAGSGFTPGEAVAVVVLEGIGAIVDEPIADAAGAISGAFAMPHPDDVPELLFGPVAVWGIEFATARETPRAIFTLTEPLPPVPHDHRYFFETGYRIDNDAIWSYFQTRGRVDIFGFPVSRTFHLLGCDVQVFQRQVAQMCEGQGPGFMNILDPDIFPHTQVNFSTFPPVDEDLKARTPEVGEPDYDQRILQFVRDNVPDVFEGVQVDFQQTFFGLITPEMAGVTDPGLLGIVNLEAWGAPISEPARDPNNANFIYQRFQRGIMHHDTATSVTRGILLADYLKQVMRDSQELPPDLRLQAEGTRFFAQYCPNEPGWLCRPGELPATDATFAFERG